MSEFDIRNPSNEQLAWGERAIDYALATRWLEQQLPARVPDVKGVLRRVEFVRCDRVTTVNQWLASGPPDLRYYQAVLCRTFGYSPEFQKTFSSGLKAGGYEVPGGPLIGMDALDLVFSVRKTKLIPKHCSSGSDFMELLESAPPKAFRALLREFSATPYSGLAPQMLDRLKGPRFVRFDANGSQHVAPNDVGWQPGSQPDLGFADTEADDNQRKYLGVYLNFLYPLFAEPESQQAWAKGNKAASTQEGLFLAIPVWQRPSPTFDGGEGAYLGWLFLHLDDHADYRVIAATLPQCSPLIEHYATRLATIEAKAAEAYYGQSVESLVKERAPAIAPLEYLSQAGGNGALLFDGYSLSTSETTRDSLALTDFRSGESFWLTPTSLVQPPQHDEDYRRELSRRFSQQLSAMHSAFRIADVGTAKGREEEIDKMRDVMAHELGKFLPHINPSVSAPLLDEIRQFLAVTIAPAHATKRGGAEAYPQEFGWGTTLRDFITWQGLIALRMEFVLRVVKEADVREEEKLEERLKDLSDVKAVNKYLRLEGLEQECRFKGTAQVPEQDVRGYFALAVIAAIRNCIGHSADKELKVSAKDGLLSISNKLRQGISAKQRRGQPKGGTESVLRYFASKYGSNPEAVFMGEESQTHYLTRFPLPPSSVLEPIQANLTWRLFVVDDSPLRTRHVGDLVDRLNQRLLDEEKRGQDKPIVRYADGWTGKANAAQLNQGKLLRALGDSYGVWLLDIDLPVESAILDDLLKPRKPRTHSNRAGLIRELESGLRAQADGEEIVSRYKSLRESQVFRSPNQAQSALILAACLTRGRPVVTISTRQTSTEGDIGRSAEALTHVPNVFFPTERGRPADDVWNTCVKELLSQTQSQAAFWDETFKRVQDRSKNYWDHWTKNRETHIAHDLVGQSLNVSDEDATTVRTAVTSLLTPFLNATQVDKIVSQGAHVLLPLVRGLHSSGNADEPRGGVSVGVLEALFAETPDNTRLQGLVHSSNNTMFPDGLYVLFQRPGCFMRGLGQIDKPQAIQSMTRSQSSLTFELVSGKERATATEDVEELRRDWEATVKGQRQSGGAGTTMHYWHIAGLSMAFDAHGTDVRWTITAPIALVAAKRNA